MIDLQKYKARICHVAGGYLIHDHKVLLVKHKKLGFWLAPGGHVEESELSYQAAEREVFEETGIRVHAISATPLIDSESVEFLPTPFVTSLHWISQENYNIRIKSIDPDQPVVSPIWPRGCEQHLGNSYILTSLSDLVLTRDPNESDDIGWFGLDDLDMLETKMSIKDEIKLAFQVFDWLKR